MPANRPIRERARHYALPPVPDGGFCPYCQGWMTHRRRFPRSRSPTRDHICPRAWGGPDSAENFRIVCYSCNLNRARAGHCTGALGCARAVALATGDTVERVLRGWNLPRPKAWGLWYRVHRAGVSPHV